MEDEFIVKPYEFATVLDEKKKPKYVILKSVLGSHKFEAIDIKTNKTVASIDFWHEGKKETKILDISIKDEENKEKKIGSFLVKLVEQEARNRNIPKIKVTSSNSAKEFYEKQGFKRTGTRKFDHPSLKTLPIYTKKIPKSILEFPQIRDKAKRIAAAKP